MNEAWQNIIAELDAERRRLVEEIVHYPPPIPRCDVQYNTLLEQRAGVAQELYRAERLARGAASPAEEAAALEAFVAASAYLGCETKQRLRSAMDGIRVAAV